MFLKTIFVLIIAISSSNAFFFSKFFKSSPKPPEEPITKDIENALRTGKFVKVYVPVYRIHYANAPPVNSISQPPIIYHSQNAMTTQVIPKRDDYPKELLEMASQLGFTDKELSQMPPFEEIKNLAGTTTDEETIEFIKDFMSTEEGRDMVKAFLNTSDDSRRRRRSVQLLKINRNRFHQYREVAEKDVALLRQIINGQAFYRRNFFSLA
ncbi:hypothetical protein ACFFRR_011847 [Megaselia abdita]